MTLHDRFTSFETQARGRIRQVLASSNEKLLEIDEALAKVAKDDWSVPAMRRQIETLRARAENLRTNALKRAGELPGEAVTRLATGTRAPIQNLAKSLSDMVRRMDTPKPKAVENEPEKGEPKIAKVS